MFILSSDNDYNYTVHMHLPLLGRDRMLSTPHFWPILQSQFSGNKYALITASMELLRAETGHQTVGSLTELSDECSICAVIPDYAKMRWLVRAPSAAQVEVLQERVINCFK